MKKYIIKGQRREVKKMWSSYQEMYKNIDNEKVLIEKRLEMVRFANEVGQI